MTKRKLLLNDYGGYAFTEQLAHEMVKRGWEVVYSYAGYNHIPHGILNSDTQSDSLVIMPLFISKPLQKYSFVRRWNQEREYGRLLADLIQKFKPDIILSADNPIDAQLLAMRAARKVNAKFIFWLQDLIGIASQRILRKRIPFFGNLVGLYFIWLESLLLRKSDHIISITQEFLPILLDWKINKDRISVIPNWSTLDQIDVSSKRNQWSESHGIHETFNFLYSGTLGLKHNPNLLLQLALHFSKNKNVRVVVISEGLGETWLKEQKQKFGIENLIILNFQPYGVFPDVLGSADALVGILEPDAGIFSVPSKVLTYLCAKRCLLLSIPKENQAARLISEIQAGEITSPGDITGFIRAAEKILINEEFRNNSANRARNYAEKTFNIEKIADGFENIFNLGNWST